MRLSQRSPLEDEWYRMLNEGEPIIRHIHHFAGLLPSAPRCKMCNAQINEPTANGPRKPGIRAGHSLGRDCGYGDCRVYRADGWQPFFQCCDQPLRRRKMEVL